MLHKRTIFSFLPFFVFFSCEGNFPAFPSNLDPRLWKAFFVRKNISEYPKSNTYICFNKTTQLLMAQNVFNKKIFYYFYRAVEGVLRGLAPLIIFFTLQPSLCITLIILCHSRSHLCTEKLMYTSALSKLRESAEISAVRYTNMNGIVS